MNTNSPYVGSRSVIRNPAFWLGVTVVVGAILRYSGVGWGLPLLLHPDEWVVVEGAVDMASRRSFEPAEFSRPDHLEIQLSYLAYEVYARLIPGAPIGAVFLADPSRLYLLARLVVATLGVACIPTAYFAMVSFGKFAALWAATLVALFPPFIEHSRYATPDVPLVLATLLAVWGCVRYIQSPKWRWLLVACGSVAWGFTAKYPAALLGAVVALSLIAVMFRDRNWRLSLWHTLAAPLLFVGFVFLFSPVLITNFGAVQDQLVGQNATGHLGADGFGVLQKLGFYSNLGFLFLGLPFVLFGILGLARVVRLRALDALPLVAGAIFWIGISTLSLHWDRWALPMYVTPILFAALGIVELPNLLVRLNMERKKAKVTTAFLASFGGLSIALSAAVVVLNAQTVDTRVVALDYVNEHNIHAENAVFEGYTPFLPAGAATVFDRFELDHTGQLMLTQLPADSERPQYLVLSNRMYDRYWAEPQYDAQQDMYQAFSDQLELISDWQGDSKLKEGSPFAAINIPAQLMNLVRGSSGAAMSGPDIQIYAIPDSMLIAE